MRGRDYRMTRLPGYRRLIRKRNSVGELRGIGSVASGSSAGSIWYWLIMGGSNVSSVVGYRTLSSGSILWCRAGLSHFLGRRIKRFQVIIVAVWHLVRLYTNVSLLKFRVFLF